MKLEFLIECHLSAFFEQFGNLSSFIWTTNISVILLNDIKGINYSNK